MNRSDKGDFSNAGDVLRVLFDKLIPEETRRSAQVLRGWTEIVGSETSMHVVPVDIRNHALLLESDHPGWSQRIRMRQEGILRAVNKKYPELGIKDLKIKVSDGKKRDRTERILRREQPVVRKSDRSTELEPEPESGGNGRETSREEDEAFFDLLEKMRRRADP